MGRTFLYPMANDTAGCIETSLLTDWPILRIVLLSAHGSSVQVQPAERVWRHYTAGLQSRCIFAVFYSSKVKFAKTHLQFKMVRKDKKKSLSLQILWSFIQMSIGSMATTYHLKFSAIQMFLFFFVLCATVRRLYKVFIRLLPSPKRVFRVPQSHLRWILLCCTDVPEIFPLGEGKTGDENSSMCGKQNSRVGNYFIRAKLRRNHLARSAHCKRSISRSCFTSDSRVKSKGCKCWKRKWRHLKAKSFDSSLTTNKARNQVISAPIGGPYVSFFNKSCLKNSGSGCQVFSQKTPYSFWDDLLGYFCQAWFWYVSIAVPCTVGAE